MIDYYVLMLSTVSLLSLSLFILTCLKCNEIKGKFMNDVEFQSKKATKKNKTKQKLAHEVDYASIGASSLKENDKIQYTSHYMPVNDDPNNTKQKQPTSIDSNNNSDNGNDECPYEDLNDNELAKEQKFEIYSEIVKTNDNHKTVIVNDSNNNVDSEYYRIQVPEKHFDINKESARMSKKISLIGDQPSTTSSSGDLDVNKYLSTINEKSASNYDVYNHYASAKEYDLITSVVKPSQSQQMSLIFTEENDYSNLENASDTYVTTTAGPVSNNIARVRSSGDGGSSLTSSVYYTDIKETVNTHQTNESIPKIMGESIKL